MMGPLTLTLWLTAQSAPQVECFANEPTLFQRGAVTELAETRGAKITQYQLHDRVLMEGKLSEGLGTDPEQAKKTLRSRIDKNPGWIDRLTHAAVGESRALILKIERFPAVVVDGVVYQTDSIDEALLQHGEAQRRAR